MLVIIARALVVLTVTAVIALTAASRYLLSPERVETYLVAPLEQRLGRNLEVGRVALWPGGLIAWNIRLGEDRRLGSDPDDWAVSAEHITVGLDLSALMAGRLLIKAVSVHSPHIRLIRARNGRWNMGSLGSAPGTPAATGAPNLFSSGVGIEVERLRIRSGSVEVVDGHPATPVNLSSQVSDVSGNIVRRHDGHVDLALSGRYRRKPDEKDRALSLSGRIDLASGLVELDLDAERVDLAGLDVEAVRGTIRARNGRIDVEGFHGRAAGGEIAATGTIALGGDDTTYDGKLDLVGLDIGRVCPLLTDTPGACGSGTANLLVEIQARGLTRKAFLESLGLAEGDSAGDGRLAVRGSIALESIDLGAFDRRASDPASGDQSSEELGPYDTGAINAEVELHADEIRYRSLVLRTVSARLELAPQRLLLHDVTAEAAGGALTLDATVDLGVEGLAYTGELSLAQGNLATLSDMLPQPAWGERTGLTDLSFSFSGAGTTRATALASLKASGDVAIPSGWVRDSKIFHAVEERTGIEGFDAFYISESGGHLAIEGGRVSSDRVVLGNDEARLLARGWIGFDRHLDIQLWVGAGPDHERKLFSRGIILPYVMDSAGWTNVPLRLGGRLGKVETSVVYEAYAETAVRAVPDSAGRIVQESTGAVIDGLRELLGGIGRVVSGSPAEPSTSPAAKPSDRPGRSGTAKRHAPNDTAQP